MHRIDVVLGIGDREAVGRRKGEEKVHEREPRSQIEERAERRKESGRKRKCVCGGGGRRVEEKNLIDQEATTTFADILNDDSHAPMHVTCVASHQV